MLECVVKIKRLGVGLGIASVSDGCAHPPGSGGAGLPRHCRVASLEPTVNELHAVFPHHRSVQLNGQPLVMVDDGTLPELKPRPLRAGRTLVIPPVTMGFYVVKNVNALACRYR